MANFIMDHVSLEELKKEGKHPFLCALFDYISSGDKYSLWEDVEQFYSGDYNYYEELAEKTGCDDEDARERDNPDLYFENDYLYAWLINTGAEDTLREKYGTVENLKNELSVDGWEGASDLINFDSEASDFFDEFYYKCITDASVGLHPRHSSDDDDDDDDDDYEDLEESIIVKKAFEKLKEHNAKSEVRKIVESAFSRLTKQE